MGNYDARQNLNRQYSQIKGALAINDVAVGFGKGWIIFAILSSMASAFSFYQDFNKTLGVVVTVILVVALAVALEAFKHLSIKGMFSDMNLTSRSLVSFLAIGLIGISFYTHYKSIQTFQSNLVTDDLRNEISYQRDLQKVQNLQISSILKTNSELAKAMNNGTSMDDAEASSSAKSNNELIAILTKLSAKNNMNNTNLLLQESRATAKTTASAILVIFIMIELMALFSIVSKIIVVDNVSGAVKGFFNLTDRLEELEANSYQSLGYQKIQQTEQKLTLVQAKNKQSHNEQIADFAKQAGLPEGLSSEQIITAIKEKFSFLKTPPTEPKYQQEKPEEIAQHKESEHKEDKEDYLECLPVPHEAQSILDDFIETEATGEKVRAIDPVYFDEEQKKALEILWDYGANKIGDKLALQQHVIEELAKMGIKNPEGLMNRLNHKLKKRGYVEIESSRYVAKAELYEKVWKDKDVA